MIDVQTETIIPLNESPRHLPGNPHVGTIYRWTLKGVRGVKLETILRGGRRFTSIESLTRFIERTTAAGDGAREGARTPRRRMAAIERAEAELEDDDP